MHHAQKQRPWGILIRLMMVEEPNIEKWLPALHVRELHLGCGSGPVDTYFSILAPVWNLYRPDPPIFSWAQILKSWMQPWCCFLVVIYWWYDIFLLCKHQDCADFILGQIWDHLFLVNVRTTHVENSTFWSASNACKIWCLVIPQCILCMWGGGMHSIYQVSFPFIIL